MQYVALKKCGYYQRSVALELYLTVLLPEKKKKVTESNIPLNALDFLFWFALQVFLFP